MNKERELISLLNSGMTDMDQDGLRTLHEYVGGQNTGYGTAAGTPLVQTREENTENLSEETRETDPPTRVPQMNRFWEKEEKIKP